MQQQQQQELLKRLREQAPYRELIRAIGRSRTIELRGTAGSATALCCANVALEVGGIHLVIADDRDEAAYCYNDLYAFLDPERVFFFPTAYKRSIEYNKEDPSGAVQRSTVLNALKNHREGYLVVCTYPEAILEKVVTARRLRENTLKISQGERLPIAFIAEVLQKYDFEKVDFVYEPGQYSVRGGIIDIFSYADNKPYRLDFFDDEIESIRQFDIGTQLSVGTVSALEILPDTKNAASGSEVESLMAFAGEALLWVADYEYTLKRFADIRVKLLHEMAERGEELESIDRRIITRAGFVEDTRDNRLITIKSTSRERRPDETVTFSQAPQPAFNKNFEVLADNIRQASGEGYTTYILSENKAQIERLENIFSSTKSASGVRFEPLSLTLHAGFTDHAIRANFYTDHQIFDRFHRYTLHKEIDRSEALTIQELNSLKVGDYVTHIDHGVGRYGGLVRTQQNGKTIEQIKLIYRDNDVLFVNVHALHRISKYKDKEATPPKIDKLGSGAWQRLKANTKRHVKDIARQLIALYARRKQSEGFAFSPDSYLQYELEASFMYEDTPDQQTATRAVKEDMEAPVPMDRLVCGDVGFGKTEVAMRAAFKAALDGKQVAVLVPTTVLALQHYRTFSKRFKEFPVRVESLTRAKSTKQVNEILAALKEGKIDIIIGTHKLLGKQVEFKDLGLLVIDEEQKFGVVSKEKLRQFRENVDTLTLTATPIPRTLQFSLMGSRDMSVIATPPPNRQPIHTEVHPFNDEIIREALEFELARNGQVYFVHNRVQDIYSVRDRIRSLVPTARVAVGHGQMKPEELEKIMMDFIYGEYDVLLATTIIESGIDISNANTMIINNSQHFGLSDLHQLRGRVGRSNRKAFCYLLTPDEALLSGDARRRLRAIEEFSDLGAGFNIAMQDLDIRGAGNILGAEQSGFIADIGFEAYQKILNEAMHELRGEMPAESTNLEAGQGSDDTPEATLPTEPTTFISDVQIDTDIEAYLPDEYVGNTNEKIALYRELDNITDESRLADFASRLRDRFGVLPRPVEELLNIVRLRWICIRMGFEKAILKNGLLILHFVYNQQSAYYQTPLFAGILKYVTAHPQKIVFKQHNNRLQMTVRQIQGSAQALDVLNTLYQEALSNSNS
ncbi:MAG: transcription-repair coupling factor [Rikenellaceae bacterium]|jgi:transcription-repair coupling factor (superfamily II helicase)|nr:transcription-repair coupling factor [Rikenellaceae bacterium]